MKNYIKISIILLIFVITGNAAFAVENENVDMFLYEKHANANNMSNGVDLNLNKENIHKINVTEPVKQIEGQAFKSKEEMMTQYFQIQKKMDIEDIKVLWEATVDRNQVIKFALKKLAMPAEQRRAHSSIMAKTVSSLISGVSLLPGLLGADSITSSASTAAGSIANRVISSKNMPKQIPLTDTELIQLARLVEDLQDRIIKNYYEYKSDLEALKTAREEVLKQNMSYSVALRARDPFSIITAKKMYENALRDELYLKQKIKSRRIELERLAGDATLNELKLGKIIISDTKDKVVSKLPPVPIGTSPDFSDKSVKELADETAVELKESKNELISDLNILWNAAVERNETIRFAILKLSNPDGKTDKSNSVKKILTPLTNVASIVGVSTGDPVAATSAIFGGGFLNTLMSTDESDFNARLAKVTDADLVLLAQETDNLQQKLITLYCNYTNALADLNYVDQVLVSRRNLYEELQKKAPELKPITDAFYSETLADQYKARQNVLNTRVALEQFVGNEALLSVDKNLKQRLSLN